MALLSTTSTLHGDGRDLCYTYLGRRLYTPTYNPFYILDALRSRPTLVLGTTGYGKTELMVSMAASDMGKGRPVFYLDGKVDYHIMHKLAYYAKLSGRPFRAILPFSQGDHLSDTWNPFVSKSLDIHTIVEAFINSYSAPASAASRSGSGGGSDGDYYIEIQRTICAHLMRALHESGFSYSIMDLVYLLENEDLLKSLSSKLKPEGFQPYGELMRTRNELGREWTKYMMRFLNHLKLHRHWAINSHNPMITFEDVIDNRMVLYIGLPVNDQPQLMKSLGSLMINLLKAISSRNQTSLTVPAASVGCYVDEAGSFIDCSLAEWVCKVRSSGFYLTLGVQTISQLEGIRRGFGDEILSNVPNVYLFNPKNTDTAAWFEGLCGSMQRTANQANLEAGEETGRGSARRFEAPHVSRDAIIHQNIGQCFFSPPTPTLHPPFLAASMLPNPDFSDPRNLYYREVAPTPARRSGLNLTEMLQSMRTQVGSNNR